MSETRGKTSQEPGEGVIDPKQKTKKKSREEPGDEEEVDSKQKTKKKSREEPGDEEEVDPKQKTKKKSREEPGDEEEVDSKQKTKKKSREEPGDEDKSSPGQQSAHGSRKKDPCDAQLVHDGEDVCVGKGCKADVLKQGVRVPPMNMPHRKQSVSNKHQDGLISRQAAMSIIASCHIGKSDFHDFVCTKAFDIFSGGMYRKFLVQSRAAKEQWAIDVQSSMGKMQKLAKMLACVISTLRHAETSMNSREPYSLGRTLVSCVNNSFPPCRKGAESVRLAMCKGRSAVSSGTAGGVDDTLRCSATGTSIEGGCVEIRGNARSASSSSSSSAPHDTAGQTAVSAGPVVVHMDLEHFFHMLWFCSKIEHVIRHMSRSWMEEHPVKPLGSLCTGKAAVPKDDGDDASILLMSSDVQNEMNQTKKGNSDSDDGVSGDEQAGDVMHCREGHLLDGQDAGIQEMCEKFASDNEERISAMHAAFLYGCGHIVESLYDHPCMTEFQTTAQILQRSVPASGEASRLERSSPCKDQKRKSCAGRDSSRGKLNAAQHKASGHGRKRSAAAMDASESSDDNQDCRARGDSEMSDSDNHFEDSGSCSD